MIDRTAKGRALQRYARQCLASQHALVETARNVVRWIPRGPEIEGIRRDGRGRCAHCHSQVATMPQTIAHDFFEVWDGVAVWPELEKIATGLYVRRVSWYQVTTLDHLAHRRAKILTSGFPTTNADMILAWVAGTGGRSRRHFRVYRGPEFAAWSGETMTPPPRKRTASLVSAC